MNCWISSCRYLTNKVQNKLEGLTGLHIMGLIIIALGVLILGVVILVYLTIAGNRLYLKNLQKNIEQLKQAHARASAERETKNKKLEECLIELTHDHKGFDRIMEEYSKSIERIERYVTAIKDNQATYINARNENAANGNKVKVYSGKENTEGYQTALLNTLIEQLVDRAQGYNTTPPPQPHHDTQ